MIHNTEGRHYLESGGLFYRLDHPTNGVVVDGRQATLIAKGEYGLLAQAIYEAQDNVGAPHRFAWRGVTNSLGDFAEVLPPTKSRRAL